MKSLKLFPFLFLLAACTGGTPKYDATGTFEATEVIVSAEASGKLLSFDIEEGTTLKDGQEVGIIYGGKNEACQYVVGLKKSDCFGFQSVMVE